MASRDPSRPNIVLILSDDQGPWALGCAGNSEIHTPNLDRLAAEGTRLEHFYCVSPVCSPARASLMTGRVPSAHGIHDAIWRGEFGPEPISYLGDLSAVTDMLAAAGWTCGHVGKWHLGDASRPQLSLSQWFVWDGGDPYHDPRVSLGDRPEQLAGYSTDLFTDAAIAMIDRSAGDGGRPFFVNLWYNAPHTPWVGVHPPAWIRFYDDCPFTSCSQEPVHPWTRPPATDWAPYVAARRDPRPSLAGYFAAVSAMDAAIGRVVARLDEHGLDDSTLVVFLSDNGFSCGHNGVWGKGNGTKPQNLFENSIRVPAIVRQPGRVAAGAVRTELVSGYDLRPTLLEWAGVPDAPDPLLAGRSFASVLTGSGGGHDFVVVYNEYGPARSVRAAEWKYVHRNTSGPHELYNLADDPNERRNLFGDPAHASTVADLRLLLVDWFRQHLDPVRDGAVQPVTGRGQIAPLPPEAQGQPAFNPEDG